ncbi:23S rRNA (guanosine(2251)-2'-O)-methyltransferase RlmB [Alphaproteobacteria bacterium LSUCC0684]
MRKNKHTRTHPRANAKPGDMKSRRQKRPPTRSGTSSATPEKRQKTLPERMISCPPGKVMIWGRHAALSALCNPKRRISAIYLDPGHTEWFQSLELEASHPAPIMMDKITMAASLDSEDKAVHQGVIVIAAPLAAPHLDDWLGQDLPERPLVLLLDQITDTRNIGAIMRSARAFRAAAIITTDRHCPEENATMLRAASGAAEHIPLIRVTNLAQAMEKLKDHGFTIAGLTAQGTTPIQHLATEQRLGLVLGAEGKGLRRLTTERADLLVRIPIDDDAESLNVSNAAAVALFAVQP